MVIRLPGTPSPNGPQPGPEPAWAHFTRTTHTGAREGEPGQISMQAIRPDVAAYRVLGAPPASSRSDSGEEAGRRRNSHNSSVYISRLDRQAQRPSASLTRLPVMGEIAAGQYDVTVAFQEHDCLDYEGGVQVDKAMARGGAYALRVRGTSMTHVGIEPGDMVVVRPQSWADDGDFVVANFTEGEAGGSEGLATLKRIYKRRDHVFLQSATASTEPIRLFAGRGADADPVRVQGVVTMVLKAAHA